MKLEGADAPTASPVPAPAAAVAAAPSSGENIRIWTFSVGVSKYRQADLALRFAAADAQAVDAFFASPAGGSVPDTQRVLLTDEQATRTDVLDQLHKLVRRTQDNDMLIVFLALHGVPDTDSELYFAMSDTDPGKLSATGLPEADLNRELGRARAKRILVLADACHSGALGFSGVRGARGAQASETNALVSKIASTGTGTAILSASSANELSQEDDKFGGGHGAFTASLLEGLKGPADADKDGFVTIREVFDYTYQKVPAATNGEQHPVLNGNYDRVPVALVGQATKVAGTMPAPVPAPAPVSVCPPGTGAVNGGCAPLAVQACPEGSVLQAGHGCVSTSISRGRRIAGYATLGGGALLGIAAGVLELQAIKARDAASCQTGAAGALYCTQSGASDWNHAKSLATTSQWVGLGGLAAGLSSAALFLWPSSPIKAESASVAVEPWVDPSGGAGLRFGGAL